MEERKECGCKRMTLEIPCFMCLREAKRINENPNRGPVVVVKFDVSLAEGELVGK